MWNGNLMVTATGGFNYDKFKSGELCKKLGILNLGTISEF